MKYQLFLASDSFGRKQLLTQAQIPFQVISHSADEASCSLNQPLELVVEQIAELKMAHVTLPVGIEGQIVFVLTADTLTLDSRGQLLGKPVDRQDAIKMLQNLENTVVGTAFCLEKKEYRNGQWHTLQRVVDYDQASCTVDVPADFIDFYLSNVRYLQVSGAVSIDGLGEQFVKNIDGNYSAIMGMPMFKLREALFKFGFYEKQ